MIFFYNFKYHKSYIFTTTATTIMRCNIINMAGETTQLELKVNSSSYDMVSKIEESMNVSFRNIDLYKDDHCFTHNLTSFLEFVLYDNMEITLIDNGKPVRIFDDSIIHKNNSWSWDIESMESIYGTVEEWDVSWVTDMSYAFDNNKTFNKDINKWDVSNVYTMESMFNSSVFNKPLCDWDVSNVVNMDNMFSFSECFNQNINTWKVSNVTYMRCMFGNLTTFNQPLNKWNVSNVKDMSFMFADCHSFDQDIHMWDVKGVENMNCIFENCDFTHPEFISWDNGD